MTRYAAETSVSVEKSRAEIESKLTPSRRYYAKEHAARANALAEQRSARTSPPPLELPWAAGLFEGEGTVTIPSRGRKGYTRPNIQVTSTDREVVELFQARWPGLVKHGAPRKPTHLPRWTWWLQSGEPAWRFLDDLLPYIRRSIVRRKFAIVMTDIDARRQGSREARYREACQSRAAEIRVLNRRGPPLLGMGT